MWFFFLRPKICLKTFWNGTVGPLPWISAVDLRNTEDKDFWKWLIQKRKKHSITREEKKAKDARTIFVGNVPVDIKSKEIIKFFKKHGPVESVRIRSVAVVGTKVSEANIKLRYRTCRNIQLWMYSTCRNIQLGNSRLETLG